MFRNLFNLNVILHGLPCLIIDSIFYVPGYIEHTIDLEAQKLATKVLVWQSSSQHSGVFRGKLKSLCTGCYFINCLQ